MPVQAARRANLHTVIRMLEQEGLSTRESQAGFLQNAVTALKLQVMLDGGRIEILFARHVEHVMSMPRGWMSEPHGDRGATTRRGCRPGSGILAAVFQPLARSMSLVRIYIMHPSSTDALWHVSEDGKEGDSYRDGLVAMHAACDRARVLEEMGFDVQVRQEGADGSWQIIRE